MNKKLAIIFSSRNGLTKKISSFLKSSLETDIHTDIYPVHLLDTTDLSSYKIIIVGSSIYHGKHDKKIHSLVKKNKKLLEKKKTAFFTVNVVARKKNKSSSSNNPYLIKFLKTTKWKPDLTGVFAGQVNYPVYSFMNKLIIRFIMFLTQGPTDTTKCHNFTDWNTVVNFSEKIKLLMKK